MVSTEKHINIVYTVKIKYKNSPYTAQTHHKHRTNPTQTQKTRHKYRLNTTQVHHTYITNTAKTQ